MDGLPGLTEHPQALPLARSGMRLPGNESEDEPKVRGLKCARGRHGSFLICKTCTALHFCTSGSLQWS